MRWLAISIVVTLAPAARADTRFCFAPDATFAALVADDSAATVCTSDQPAKCGRVDLKTGTWSAAAVPTPAPAPASTAAYQVKQDRGVSICHAGKCSKLAVPAPTKDSGPYSVEVSDDGKLAVLGSALINGVWFYDVAANKKVKALSMTGTEDNGCLDSIASLGAFVYISVGVCAGPGAEGRIYDWRGNQIGRLDINTYNMTPLAFGDVWAVPANNGDSVAVIAAKTAAVTPIAIPQSDCEACKVNGDVTTGHAYAKTPAGKLVLTSPSGVAVIDPVTRKVDKQLAFAVCPAPH
jgi:hypothetical protein